LSMPRPFSAFPHSLVAIHVHEPDAKDILTMNPLLRRFGVVSSWVLAATILLQARSFADRYSLTQVESAQMERFYDGDDFGNYTIEITNRVNESYPPHCGTVMSFTSCYETRYVNNPNLLITTTPPSLRIDPNPIAGTDSCALAPGTGFHAYSMLCNNGHMIFAGEYDFLGGNLRGIWAGSNPDVVLDYLGDHSIDGGFMTSNGNAYFIDGLHDSLDVAIDLDARPIPEPESISLLGIGIFGLIGVVRRRLRNS